MDILDTPLDPKLANSLLGALFEQRLRQQDPMQQAKVQATQMEIEQAKRQQEQESLVNAMRLPPPQVAPRSFDELGSQTRSLVTDQMPLAPEEMQAAQGLDPATALARVAQLRDQKMRQANQPRPQVQNVGELAALVQRLKGMSPEMANQVLARFTGIEPRDKSADALALAQARYNLGSDQRDFQNMSMLQRLDMARQQLDSLNKQRETENALATQRLSAMANRPHRPTVPYNAATKILEGMAKKGATDAQLQEIAQGFGYPVTGTRPSSGWFGLPGPNIPVLGDVSAATPEATPEAATQAAPQAAAAPEPKAATRKLTKTTKAGHKMYSDDGGQTWRYQ